MEEQLTTLLELEAALGDIDGDWYLLDVAQSEEVMIEIEYSGGDGTVVIEGCSGPAINPVEILHTTGAWRGDVPKWLHLRARLRGATEPTTARVTISHPVLLLS